MTTLRWTLHDPVVGDTYTMEINPNAMTALGGPLQVRAGGVMPKGAVLLFGRPALPAEWQFSGVLRTEAQYDAFVEWMGRPNRINLTDHLGRTIVIQIKSFQPTAGRARKGVPWRHTYTINALVFSVVNGPIGNFLLDGFETAPTGAALDTTTAYQGSASGLVTLQHATSGLLFHIYSTVAPIARTYATPWNLAGENKITMRMQWPGTETRWIANATMRCTLTLTSAAGNATITDDVFFPAGDASWRLATFPLTRDFLTGTVGSLDDTAVTGYSLTLTTVGAVPGLRSLSFRLDNQRAKP